MRILIITKMPPYPPNIGGNQRTNLIHRALSRHGQVDVLLAQDPSWLPASHMAVMKSEFSLVGCVPPKPRGSYRPWGWVRPLCPGVIDRAAHHLGARRLDFQPDPLLQAELHRLENKRPYDLLVGMELRTTFKCGLDTKRLHILDLIDLDTDYYRSRLADNERGPIQRILLARHLKQLEKIIPPLLEKSRWIWVASQTDLSQPGLQHARVLPNIPFVGPDRDGLEPLPSSERPVVLFVGSFYHAPNVEGMMRFLKKIWPPVVQSFPGAQLQLYGMGVPAELRAQCDRAKNVTLLGSSSPLREAYEGCAFAVAPIYSGAGTCFKVVESLALGRTLVLSPYAGRGYDGVVEHGQTVWMGRTDEEMAAGCIQLLNDRAMRNRLAGEGSRRVNERYSFRRFQDVVNETMEDIRKSVSDHAFGQRHNKHV